MVAQGEAKALLLNKKLDLRQVYTRKIIVLGIIKNEESLKGNDQIALWSKIFKNISTVHCNCCVLLAQNWSHLNFSKKYTSIVVYFEQLLGAACTQKLEETFFCSRFQPFCLFQTFYSNFTYEINKNHLKMNKKCFFLIFCWLLHEITEKGLKWTKMVEKWLKKMLRPAFRCAPHPKAGRNKQHSMLLLPWA